MKTLLITTLLLASFSVVAGEPRLYNGRTGEYLGRLSSNQYDSDSTSNPYGTYGSKYSSQSINNPYGQYGSKYSSDSANNPYATNAPVIVGDE